MYAVVKTGGKQYKVAVGEKLKVERLPALENTEILLDEVLMIAGDGKVVIGQPFIAGAGVKAMVLNHGRHDKIHIF